MQTSIAGVVILVLFVVDIVLVVSRVIQSAPATVTSPSEQDDGALGIFVIPIIIGIAAALPTSLPFFEPSSLLVGVSTLLVAIGLTTVWVPRREGAARSSLAAEYGGT